MSPRLILILAAAGAALMLSGGLYWKGRRDDAAWQRPKIETAMAAAAVAHLETQGAQDSTRRVDAAVRRRDAAKAIVADLTPKALKSEDAYAPLDPERAARLRDADDGLCLAAPELAGCSADRNAR